MSGTLSVNIKESFYFNNFTNILLRLVKQNLTLRYRRTFFGYLWSLLNPLLIMSVSAVVFSTLFKIDFRTYAIYLFAGMIPWNCFSQILSQSCSSIINNEGLIKKIYIPKVIFPLSLSITILIDNFLSFLALFIIALLIGAPLSCYLLFIPISFMILFVFAFGIALFLSIATVYFRDIQHIINILLQALFFLTPIMYKNAELSGKLGFIIKLNPLVYFIELFRDPIYSQKLPSINAMMLSISFASITLLFCLYFFSKYQNNIIYRI